MGCAISQEETFSLADLGLEIEDAGDTVRKINHTGHSKEVVTLNFTSLRYCIANWVVNMHRGSLS